MVSSKKWKRLLSIRESQVEMIGWDNFGEANWGKWSNKWFRGNTKCKNESTKEEIKYRMNSLLNLRYEGQICENHQMQRNEMKMSYNLMTDMQNYKNKKVKVINAKISKIFLSLC